MRVICVLLTIAWGLTRAASAADEVAPTWRDAIIFHAPFDQSPNAAVAAGDPKIYTGDSLKREKIASGIDGSTVEWTKAGGHVGGALRFKSKTPKLVFFKGGKNVPYRKQHFSGTVSLRMKLSPKEDLPKGYVDPLQITDKKWDDASFFVDFDQGEARDFRLGVFSDTTFWNPKNRKFDEIPSSERPMVTVQQPPFKRDRWTHVAFVWNNFNDASSGRATLYIDGKAMGSLIGPQRFSWDPEQAVIMLGINYIGMLDDLAIFSRALTDNEIVQLMGAADSIE